MSATPDNMDTIARALARLALVSNDRELWTFDDIAVYAKYERNYVQNVLVLQPGFPAPIRAVTERSSPRYVAGEVMRWFEGRR